MALVLREPQNVRVCVSSIFSDVARQLQRNEFENKFTLILVVSAICFKVLANAPHLIAQPGVIQTTRQPLPNQAHMEPMNVGKQLGRLNRAAETTTTMSRLVDCRCNAVATHWLNVSRIKT